MRLTLLALLLLGPILGCSQESTSYAHREVPAFQSPEYVDVVQVLVQVCLPGKKVAFEDVEIDLSGAPAIRTLAEERRRNGWPSARADAPAIECRGGIAEGRDIARRWLPSDDPKGIQKSWLPFGDVTLTNDVGS